MSVVQITPLNIGFLRAKLADWYGLPSDHPLAGQVDELPFQCYHIMVSARSVLVDAAAYEFPEGVAEMAIPGFHIPPLLDQLSVANIDAGGISDVILTHSHFDHITALTRFEEGRYVPVFYNARHYLGSGDWLPEQFTDLEEHTLQVVKNWGLLSLVKGPLDLGDGLTIIPAPGETPGHQILQVVAGDMNFYFAGDLYHHPLEFEEVDRNVQWADQELIQTSKKALMEIVVESGAKVFFTHLIGSYQVEKTGNGLHWCAV